MPTQEIPSYEWGRFFDEFSGRHRGWLVTIEMLGLDAGDQVQALNLPLEGIAVEPNEVGEDQITIVAGDPGDERISHTISAPNRVWLKQNDEGADEALEIETFNGAVLLSFRATVLPELVDGLFARSVEVGKSNS